MAVNPKPSLAQCHGEFYTEACVIVRQSQAQCTPMPLPALGTQRIIQGNGTNVGTVISLQCPAKHKLVGALTCVMVNNSTHWEGNTFCEPSYEDFGFRVAVLASIVSTAIILLMSMAFITCCLLDCIKEDKRKKQEREGDVWQWEERAQHEDHRSHYSHKGRNNNNNTQEKILSPWDTHNPAICDNMQGCRCYQQYANGFVRTYDPNAPLAALPGHGYDQPLLPRNPEYAQISGPPQYPGAPPSSGQTPSPGLVKNSAAGPGLVRQYGRQHSSLSGANASTAEECNTRSINPPKEFPIRIISV
ncbi:uncharacterized protein LOC118317109 isoform X2 [Scophthalmus maximus]|uniref:uncharacterized protein LOC118317109 isoform X2 n=1 Tax=Scophthalmus maximus TaxID=52904 RepID=UPI0015E0B1FA|nr:uncharacterized protein LOC118317109 isoform X2 [Scophthalmus maximus]